MSDVVYDGTGLPPEEPQSFDAADLSALIDGLDPAVGDGMHEPDADSREVLGGALVGSAVLPDGVTGDGNTVVIQEGTVVSGLLITSNTVTGGPVTVNTANYQEPVREDAAVVGESSSVVVLDADA